MQAGRLWRRLHGLREGLEHDPDREHRLLCALADGQERLALGPQVALLRESLGIGGGGPGGACLAVGVLFGCVNAFFAIIYVLFIRM